MPISTSTTFNMTTTQLIKAALRKIGVIGDGQAPSTTQISNGAEALNAMLKTFQADGMPLWAISETTVTPTATHDYTVGIGQTVNIPAPLKVTQVYLLRTSNQVSRPLEVKTHYDYRILANFSSVGAPTSYWYEPLNQSGILHIWPIPDTDTITNTTIRMVYQRPFFDMDSSTDTTLDFPQWWMEAVIYGLAWRLSPEYGVPLNDRAMLQKEAEFFHQTALSYGTEEGSVFFMPDWTTRGIK